MKDRDAPKDEASQPPAGKDQAKTGREAALAEALRANLRRRKTPSPAEPRKPR